MAMSMEQRRKARYGNRTFQIEPYGVERVGQEERHGDARSQFTLWLGSNLTIADFALGFLPVSLGLPWPWIIVSILVGNLAGSLLLGACSAMGPSYGAPQLIIGRYSFGRIGGVLPALLNYVSTIGWFAVNNILGTFGLRVLFPVLSFWQGAFILVFIQGLLAIYGYNLIHAYERVMSVVLAILFAIVTVLSVTQTGRLAAYHPTTTGVWPLFAIMVAAAFSYVGSWGPYASDYSRYLPAHTDRKKIIAHAFFGSFLASIWLELVGAVVAVLAGSAASDPIAALHSVTGGFGAIAVIAVVLGGTAADALNLYSNALSAGALGIRLPRWILAVGASLLGLILSLLGSGNFEQNYENFLLMLGYWMTPWVGVLITDFFVLQRYRMAYEDRRASRNVYWPGLMSFLIGIVCSLPFMDGPFYEGAISKAMGGADLSFYVGFLVAALVYYFASKKRDAPIHT